MMEFQINWFFLISNAWSEIFDGKKKKKKPRICLDRTYSAETENWKHCSKIIFKCVNSTVGSIFNENNCWKVEFVNPWIVHGYTVHHGKVNLRGYYSMNSAWTVVALLLKCVKKKKRLKHVESKTWTQ